MSVRARCGRRELHKRINYFLSEEKFRRRGEILRIIRELDHIGEVAIVGGMLRDLFFVGNRYFRSDVDMVIAPTSDRRFYDCMERRYNAKVNKFGGYKIVMDNWTAEVWNVKDTWTNFGGLYMVQSFEDVVNTTFFDVDAIMYNVSTGRLIHKERYFERAQRKILGINFYENPDPVKCAIRAMRYRKKYGLEFNGDLKNYVEHVVEAYGLGVLMERERSSFGDLLGTRDCAWQRLDRKRSCWQACTGAGRVYEDDKLSQLCLPLKSRSL